MDFRQFQAKRVHINCECAEINPRWTWNLAIWWVSVTTGGDFIDSMELFHLLERRFISLSLDKTLFQVDFSRPLELILTPIEISTA